MDKLENVLNELRKLRPACKDLADRIAKAPTMFKLTIARSLDVLDPTEENLIQQVVDILEPAPMSGTEERKVRDEMDKMFADGQDILDPKVEQEWEKKLQEARDRDKGTFEKNKAERIGVEADPAIKNLSDIKGLGEKSINKLMEAGIRTVEEFYALSHDQKKTILGAIVAETFKI